MLFFKKKRKQSDAHPEQSVEQATQDNSSPQGEEVNSATNSPAHNAPDAPIKNVADQTAIDPIHEATSSTPESSPKLSWLKRVKQGLSRTSSQFSEGMANVFLGKKEIDDDLLEEIETQLLLADVGMRATLAIVESLTARVARNELKDPESLRLALVDLLEDQLRSVDSPANYERRGDLPCVILVVGVNGVGKTTTIGKLAKQLQNDGKRVMLAAGDTFRAAAVEQLQVWGERNDVPVIAQHTGADSASVIFDAVQAAQARNIDVLIADTAGRVQNKANLMEELEKVVRVMKKLDPEAPHEVLLVLDAGTGQNAISQTKLFSEAVNVTGLALTKLDGTAKGGIIFALASEFNVPVRFIGVGEGIDDLQAFNAREFSEALFQQTTS